MASPLTTSRRARLGRAVFELYLLAACALIGIAGLLLPAARAKSIVGAFPPWAQIAWYAGISIAGMLAGAGIIRGDVFGSLVERGSLIVIAGMCASFGIASMAYAGQSSLTGSMMLFGFAVPCVVRARQITVDLNVVRAELRYRASMTGEIPIVMDDL